MVWDTVTGSSNLLDVLAEGSKKPIALERTVVSELEATFH